MGVDLTARHVGELVSELAPLLEGTVVRDVQALPPRDVLLALLEADGRVLRVRLSAAPEACRIHLQVGRVQAHRGPLGPFFRSLERELPGRPLTGLRQESGDRIVRLCFGPTEDDASPDRGVELVLELTGRHGNLVLLDATGTVRALLVPPPDSVATPRLAVGSPWSPPPGRPGGADPGPGLLQALTAPGDDSEGSGSLARLAPLSARVEAVLGGAASDRRQDSLRTDLAARLRRRRKSAASRLAGLAKRRAACAGAERVRQDGELVKAAQGELRRGQGEAVLQDWFEEGAPPRTVALDPKLTPRENAERLFKRAKKLEREALGIDAEEGRAQEDLARVEAFLAEAEDPARDPEEVEQRARAERVLPPRQGAPSRREKPAPRLPYRRFTGAAGSEIRVGRNARDNDQLSLKESRGNDLWLHTRDAPGSHVVLRLEGGAEPDDEEVLDAAHLALHFSPLRGARKAAIHVARCKEVKKPKGAPPGLVMLSGGRTLQLRVEEERLKRLLDPRGLGAGGPDGAGGGGR